MTPTKIAVYDFDGTLFRSPEKPVGWDGGWWGNTASLSPPVVPQDPGAEWWNGSVVQRAKQDISNTETLTVLLTGRLQKKFTLRVRELLAQAGLKFDHVFLAPGGDTESYKLKVLTQLVKDNPTARGVDIWEDRANHLAKFSDHVESMGRAAYPHLITVAAHEPGTDRTASPVNVVDRYLRG